MMSRRIAAQLSAIRHSRTSYTAGREKNGRSEGLRPIALEELPFAYALFLDTADSLTS